MCPGCIATAALIIGSVISSGGVAALAAKKFGAKRAAPNAAPNAASPEKGKEKHDGQRQT